jgi:putative hydrolase of the HAD superfamily
MTTAVIFDWFGTLARWEHSDSSNYSAVLRAFGYEPEQRVIDDYHVTWDGIDHRQHSTSRDTYLDWSKSRMRALTSACGVPSDQADEVIAALVESDRGASMVAYTDTLPVLESLRSNGYSIGICSNWGWDLQPFLDATAVAPLLDAAVTSAQAGYRKPHPGIYDVTLARLGVAATDAVFVGDSWGPDVLGPLGAGMRAVHIRRDDASGSAPDLVDGAYRISTLNELVDLPVIGGSALT